MMRNMHAHVAYSARHSFWRESRHTVQQKMVLMTHACEPQAMTSRSVLGEAIAYTSRTY